MTSNDYFLNKKIFILLAFALFIWLSIINAKLTNGLTLVKKSINIPIDSYEAIEIALNDTDLINFFKTHGSNTNESIPQASLVPTTNKFQWKFNQKNSSGDLTITPIEYVWKIEFNSSLST